MVSKVGNSQIYEDREQRISKQAGHNPPKKRSPDQGNIDIEDLDKRGIWERIAEGHHRSLDATVHGQSAGADPKADPLGPAVFHGDEPSKGAKIDVQIMAEEREELAT